MTYVVAEPCVNCRYTDCALVCPVEAFHLDDDMLVIHPETCIDCDACVPECPVEAVFAEAAVPRGMDELHATQCRTSAERAADDYRPFGSALRVGIIMKKRTRWLLGGLALGAGSISAALAYWKKNNRPRGEESRRCLGQTGNAGDVQG